MKMIKFSLNCEKWLLISLLSFNLVIVLTIAAISDLIASNLAKNISSNSLFNSKAGILYVISIATVFWTVFLILGIYSAYKQNYCLIVTFGVFMIINTIFILFTAVIVLFFIPLAVINLIITALSLKYAISISDELYISNLVQEIDIKQEVFLTKKFNPIKKKIEY
jgi:hypothetical protein